MEQNNDITKVLTPEGFAVSPYENSLNRRSPLTSTNEISAADPLTKFTTYEINGKTVTNPQLRDMIRAQQQNPLPAAEAIPRPGSFQ